MNARDFYYHPVANNNINQYDTPYINNIASSKNSNYIIAKADSGASNNYWHNEDKQVLKIYNSI